MRNIDSKAVHPKYLAVEEHVQLLVVGGGPAGVAAAIEAASAGLSVMLVDEHPVDANLMRLDVPFLFGQRMDASVQDRERILRQIVSKQTELDEAYEAGVDIRLSTAVWGVFMNRPDVAWLAQPMAGLADGARSWMVGFERAIIAAGRRDLGVGFPGWQRYGVTGVTGATALIDRYDAFTGRSLVILGSSAESLSFALQAHKIGLDVRAVIEAADKPVGPVHLAAELERAGIPLLLSAVPTAAEGEDEVCCLRLARIDAHCRAIPRTEQAIACDTICLGIGVVPNVEAIGMLGGALVFRRDRGGHIPLLDGTLRTSIPQIFAAGDCTGITPGKSLDPELARAEGRLAARSAIASLGLQPSDAHPTGLPTVAAVALPGLDMFANLALWLRAISNTSSEETVICQCEEVTRAALLTVSPPRYLHWTAGRAAETGLAAMQQGGTLSQDQIKRMTRAGMGYCQGRRCREQTAVLLAAGADLPIENIAMPRFRPPLRPLPLGVLQADDFHAELAATWDVWFGIKSQWTPYWAFDDPSDVGKGVTYGK